MSDSGLALDAKLHGTYDNGGPVCCKRTARWRFLHMKEAVTTLCAHEGEGWDEWGLCARPGLHVPVTLYIHTCKRNAAVFLLTLSLVKYIIPCVISILFPVWQLISPGLQWNAGLYTAIANWFLFLTSSTLFFSCFCSYMIHFEKK